MEKCYRNKIIIIIIVMHAYLITVKGRPLVRVKTRTTYLNVIHCLFLMLSVLLYIDMNCVQVILNNLLKHSFDIYTNYQLNQITLQYSKTNYWLF